MFLRVVELRLHFPAPLLGIFVVHLLHLFRHVRVLFHDVFTHLLDHLVPRVRRNVWSHTPPRSLHVIVFIGGLLTCWADGKATRKELQ
jgi:hypothetical protein